MDIDRKTLAEFGLSGGIFLTFIIAASVVSQTYATPVNRTANESESVAPVIGPDGGLPIIGVIALFVVLMGTAGVWMYRANFEKAGAA